MGQVGIWRGWLVPVMVVGAVAASVFALVLSSRIDEPTAAPAVTGPSDLALSVTSSSPLVPAGPAPERSSQPLAPPPTAAAETSPTPSPSDVPLALLDAVTDGVAKVAFADERRHPDGTPLPRLQLRLWTEAEAIAAISSDPVIAAFLPDDSAARLVSASMFWSLQQYAPRIREGGRIVNLTAEVAPAENGEVVFTFSPLQQGFYSLEIAAPGLLLLGDLRFVIQKDRSNPPTLKVSCTEASPLTVRVRSSDGKPIRGATVSVSHGGAATALADTGKGLYTGMVAGTTVALSASHDGYAPAYLDRVAVPAADDPPIDVTLLRSVHIVVRIKAPEDADPAWIETCLRLVRVQIQYERAWADCTPLPASGVGPRTAEFPPLAPGTFRAALLHGPALDAVTPEFTLAEGERYEAVIEPDRGASLTVRVQTASASPMSGMTVLVHALDDQGNLLLQRTNVTGTDGNARIDGLPARAKCRVSAYDAAKERKGHVERAEAVAGESVTLVFVADAVLSLRVAAADGTPILHPDGIWLMADATDAEIAAVLLHLSAEPDDADADGSGWDGGERLESIKPARGGSRGPAKPVDPRARVMLSGAPGTHTLIVQERGHAAVAVQITLVAGKANEVDVTLPAARNVRLRVVDAAGAPAEGEFAIDLRCTSDVRAPDDPTDAWAWTVTTSLDGSVSFAGLAPLTFTAALRGGSPVAFDLRTATSVTVEIPLVADAMLTGVVWLPDGGRASNARVSIEARGPEGEESGIERETTTGDDGAYTFAGVRTGVVEIWVRRNADDGAPNGYGASDTLRVFPGANRIDVALTALNTRIATAKLEPVQVTLSLKADAALPDGMGVSLVGLDWRSRGQPAPVDSAGRAVLSAVPPGNYTLAVYQQRVALPDASIAVTVREAPLEQTIAVTVPVSTFAFRGEDDSGASGSVQFLTGPNSDRLRATTPGYGLPAVRGRVALPSGSYWVSVTIGTDAPLTMQVTLPIAHSEPVVVPRRASASIDLKITGPHGVSLRGLRVLVAPSGGTTGERIDASSLPVDERLQRRVVVAAGTYHIYAYTHANLEKQISVFGVARGIVAIPGGPASVEIAVTARSLIQVRVTTAAGTPASNLGVTVSSEDPADAAIRRFTGQGIDTTSDAGIAYIATFGDGPYTVTVHAKNAADGEAPIAAVTGVQHDRARSPSATVEIRLSK